MDTTLRLAKSTLDHLQGKAALCWSLLLMFQSRRRVSVGTQ
jgi:hypothetical protein